MIEAPETRERFGSVELGLFAVALAGAVMLAAAVLSLPDAPADMVSALSLHLEETGLTNPVNAVLINFRGVETMMEKAVVLLALLGGMALVPTRSWRLPLGNLPRQGAAQPELSLLMTVVLPLAVLVAFYLFWTGADEPGGAFQGGTILASAALLVVVSGQRQATAHGAPWLRALAVLGVLGFLGAGMVTLALGRGFLDFPPAHAKAFAIAIELALMPSVAALLFLLAGGSPSEPQEAGSPS